MSYNFINEAASIRISHLCVYDTAVGYEADFSENGNVDGWNQYPGIHTYGCWNGFLFGAYYGGYGGYIGRQNVFIPVPAETHYTLKIAMKINPVEDSTASTGRVMWKTISYPSWTSDKTKDFTVYTDNNWHTYSLNMGEDQWWQGDINDLRFYPLASGTEGDEFFIRSIKITSVAEFSCMNPTCSYYNNYSHPCAGIGERAYCLAASTDSNYYTVVSGINDELTVNINGYGSETIKLTSAINVTGDEVARDLTKNISKVDIGGYSEAEVNYSEQGKFKIYSGTYTDDSSVVVENSSAAATLGFFNESGNDISTKSLGDDPVNGFKPKSSFKIKSFQLLGLFDNNENTSFEFDPLIYNVEGGRRDWIDNGLGSASITLAEEEGGPVVREYSLIDNEGKTLIDFDHPFNASGKVKKIYISGSIVDSNGSERSNCKIKIFRPRKDGTFKTITSVSIPARQGGGKLYSTAQESITVDCEIWINRGDLLGIYNADLYVGKAIYTGEADASYFQINGEAGGEFDPGTLKGNGSAGLFIYARSEDLQKNLSIDIDLGKRVNIKDVTINGESESQNLEYNIARCLDINWQVDLFGGTHDTGHWDVWNSEWDNFNHANIAYGINCLSDGIYSAEDALSADSYSASDANGVIPSNPHYFFVNGDGEWLGILFHVPSQYTSNPYLRGFNHDPIAFNLYFPSNKNKTIYKFKTYFKEKYNFRSFALSTFIGPDAWTGNADDSKFMLIPEYSSVSIDGTEYYEGIEEYETVDDYLFANPCVGEPIIDGDNNIVNYDQIMQARQIDWNVIEHEWGPITCKGFRFYTTFHESTKINEMELYCSVSNTTSNMSGSITVLFSQYGELWKSADLTEDEDGSAEAFIGQTPTYFNIEIEPISNIRFYDIVFNVSTDDVYVGRKGCEYNVLLDHAKTDATNPAQQIEFKNVYGKPYNLHVDIAKDEQYDKGLIFFSDMSSRESIENPEVGPGARYKKKDDHPLVNQNYNCAINCPCYGLKNLVDGKTAYTSLQGGSWSEFGILSKDVSIDFSNISSSRVTIINIPVLSRNKWWKFGFSNVSHSANIREAKIFYNGTEYDCTFYYDEGLAFEDGPISDLAPHLGNDSITGSYYNLSNNKYIGFELDEQEEIDTIILYHNNISYSPCVLSIYISEDNITYSKYCDVTLTDGSHTYSALYYYYFAIDLDKRYNLEIIRNYEGSNLASLSIHYSNDDVANINDVTFDSNSRDARWARLRLLCGDGSSRYIRKLGIYPDITDYISPAGGSYNCEWESLGTAVTSYGEGTNIALNATVSGSSQFGSYMTLNHITDGVLGTTLRDAWGSNTSSSQWITIDLGSTYDIYRIKIYHGYSESDSNFMIEDYTIQTSVDASSYTTRFTITGNSDFERIHDLSEAVSARFIKMNITGYITGTPQYLPTGDGYEWFEGVVLREIEIYEDYGFDYISSEEYPIIATNMKDQFRITGHELIGVDVEDTSTDWSNANSNFCYSNSILDEPKKISFSVWGSTSGYEQWVAIKRDTATNYNDGPDYLKHAKIFSHVKKNPCEHSWWWNSNVSQLSNDHINVVDTNRSLKIEYPASTDADVVSFVEGDDFGIDSDAAWRDGLEFWWYIDNINNLDMGYGHFYFGGYYNNLPVEYRWSFSTLSGTLNTGWNNLFLSSRTADEISYTESNDPDEPDPRILNTLTLQILGLRFKGKGNAFTMYLDGFKIRRNDFLDYIVESNKGLYLANNDYMVCPLGEFDMSKGTIEFWLKPDYDPHGYDYFKTFKYRSLFHFSNVVNDVFGAVIGFHGIGIYFGNVNLGLTMFYTDVPYWDVDDLLHIGIVFSNDGTNISNDGSTIRLYVFGELASKETTTWEIGDNKYFKFILGGQNLIIIKRAHESSSINGVIYNLKIYNYCKTYFYDSIYGHQETGVTSLIKPSNFVEVSKDNVTFYGIGNPSLPLIYESVADNSTAIVYVRSCIPEGLTGSENRKANLTAGWHISV